ncbi:class I SAM-dependent RNA methyltransferase [Tomitella fengzijianii]|uniref:Class I SAM-dependent RNA methyltransferase n=1 Tax=Tomitella fengzijianii TaxID=2597660 RepID=A0A516X3F3_9ACTN|nr:TRAM domain-containing protein [Tomitella fengzijianii]QDQ97595.1 class I SAM-dependent RNA methyltransferase [Tomitella fengzijianii]
MDWTGRVLELHIDAVGHGGVFVARSEGRVVLVRRALPGERVRARVTEDKGGSYCRAEVTDVLEAAPDRVADACPAAAGGAGCCDFSHVAPAAQRRLKQEVLAEQLARIAHLPQRIPVAPLPMPATPHAGAPAGGEGGAEGWRTRIRLSVDEAGRAGYRRYRGSEVVADLRCPQQIPGALDGLQDTVWQAGADLAVAVDDDGRRHVVEIAPPPMTRAAHRRSGRRGASARRAARSQRRAEHIVEGGGSAVQRVDGREWRLAPTGFWQVHGAAAQTYSDLIREWSGLRGGDTAWDLYGGAGVFAAAMAGQVGPAGRVEVVESSSQAVRDGRDALVDLDGVRFHHARVGHALAEFADGDGGARRIGGSPGPDTVVLDPPRAGAGREVIGALAATSAARVVHVGCDPASFARDLALYGGHGFRVEELRAFDGFPMTHHFESFALLVR